MATNIQLKRSASAGAAPGTGDLELGELALNTYDGKMYMKKTVSGTSSIVELTGTQAATSSAFAHTTYKFTASGSTTTFTGSDDDSQTLSYTAGQIQVFLNGVLLDVADYTASNGTSVVLGSATDSGSILLVTSFEGTNPFDYFKYTASNAQTSFSGNDANSESLLYTVGNIQVYLNGVLLDASDYTATNGTAVVLGSGAASGDILTIWEFNETALTELSADTSPQLGGNLDVVTYDIVSTSNRNIDIVPHGTGDVTLQTDTVTLGSSGENVTVSTSGTGDLTLNTNSGSSSGSIAIADGANANITLTPNGSGKVVLDNHSWPNSDGSADQVLVTNGSGVLSFSTISSDSITDADGNTKIQVEESSDENIIRFDIAGTEQIVLADGVLKPTTTNDIDLGTSSLEFKDAFFDGTVTSDAFAGPLTGDVTGTADLATSITASANNSTDETVYPTFVDGATGTQGIETDTGLTYNPSSGLLTTTLLAGTLNTAAQTNITSLGTLTALTVDNLSLNGTTIGHTSDTDLMTLTSGNLTVAGDVYIGDSNKELRFYEGSNYVGFEAPALSANQIWVLPTADGSANQTLKTDGSGTLSWATAASAVSNLTDATISSAASGDYLRYNGSAWVNVASAGNPVLDTMTGDNSDATLTLTRAPLHENAVQVYWDGVYQHKDNWSVSGTELTFATAPPTGVKVEAVTGSQTNILYGNDVTVDKMTGDNSDTTLSLSVTPSNENHTNVYFDGVYQSKDNYTLSGTTITFSTAPPTGVLVEAVSNQSVSIGTATGIAASALTGLTEVTAADADHVLIYDASGSALKKSLVSDLVQTSEEIADIVGAMVSSNTESGITVAYQDGDNTLDFTVGTLNQDTTGTADLITASANNSTDETVYPTFVDGATGSQGIETDTGLTYNPSTGVITATQFTGAVSGNASTATEATNVTASANNSTDETVYPTFVDGATGTQGIETDTGLTYNPSSGLLTTTLLAGTLNTAAQTNITSLGTLSGLTVNGAAVFNENSADVDFRVESNGNANRFFIDAGSNSGEGAVIVGHNASLGQHRVFQISGNSPDTSGMEMFKYTNDTSGPTISMSKSRGGAIGTAAAINDNDVVGTINWFADDGTDTGNYVATIHAEIDGTPGTDDTPGALVFKTTADGTNSPNERMRIASTGNVSIGAGGGSAQFNVAKSAYIEQVALTSSSNAITWDADAAGNAYHVTTENTTIGKASNGNEGQIIMIEIAQGGTARTISWHTDYEFAASTAPTMTATANKTDIYTFRYNGGVWQELGRVQNMAQS